MTLTKRKGSVLIVDDSAFMRKALKRMLSSDPQIKVVGEARDGEEALEAVKRLRPDVITLDVKMPGMSGLTVLKRIMEEFPTPVLMVSSLTSEGGSITLEALETGAVDFIDKSSCHTHMDILNIAETLVQKVKVIMGVDLRRVMETRPALRPRELPSPAIPVPLVFQEPTCLVTIGASTGGPMSLELVLTAIPKDFPGVILVVQHMPPGFTRSLAERFNQVCPLEVKEAQEDDLLLSGHVYIAPAGYHLKIHPCGDRFRVFLSRTPCDTLHCPSVDVLMESVSEVWPGRTLSVIMTGMGSDGAEGVRMIKRRGGSVIAQDEETCVVYGMPKAAVQTGCVDRLVPLVRIAEEIKQFVMPGGK
jgi:two-component system chemotaxis response regulator CheB